MSKKEKILFWGILILNGVLLFAGLGSFKSPHTSMDLISEYDASEEIVLDMGSHQNVQTLYIHLGHILDRVVSISYYDENKEEWIVIDETADVKSNYNWNEISIGKNVRYLGIVPRNGRIVVNEIVILDDTGKIIRPANSETYPLLFDEEELFPKELTYYYRTMFDEVFYAGSAYEFLHGEAMAEITHPPMGKILISIGIMFFGITPFGWRVVTAIFGLAMLPLMYRFLHRLFGEPQIALIGMALLSFDFMHYTLARIGTLDTIIAFFILAVFSMMWEVFERIKADIKNMKDKPKVSLVYFILFHAFVVGMAVSTKWTGFYAMAGIAVFFLVFWIEKFIIAIKEQEIKRKNYLLKLLVVAIVSYTFVPLIIYMLSFLPQAIVQGDRNLFKVMFESSLSMLDFHDSIVFEHPYSCAWYTWIWNKTPLLDAINILKNGEVSMVATMGNPIIWWSGLVSFALMLYRIIRKKDVKAAYLFWAYLFMLVPWFFVKRTVFIYQYYGSSLFLICMLAYSLWLVEKKVKNFILIFLEIIICIFIMFYPYISGFPVQVSYIQKFLQWLPDWKFLG